MEKEQKKGIKKVLETERTVFNDEEQRRYVTVDFSFIYYEIEILEWNPVPG